MIVMCKRTVVDKMTETVKWYWCKYTKVEKCIDNTLGECYYNAKETSYELRKKWGERSA